MVNNLISKIITKQSSFIWFNPFTSKRIGRMRYFVWSFITLINFIFLFFIIAKTKVLSELLINLNYVNFFIWLLLWLNFFVFCALLILWQIKRLHDLNASGWWSLIGVIHIFSLFLIFSSKTTALLVFTNFALLTLNLVFNLILFSVKGTLKENKYGNPLSPNSFYLKTIFIFSLVIVISATIKIALIEKEIYERQKIIEQKYESLLLHNRQNF